MATGNGEAAEPDTAESRRSSPERRRITAPKARASAVARAAQRAAAQKQAGKTARQAGPPEPEPDAAATGPSELWQARIGRQFGAQLLDDADVLGLSNRTEIVRAALELLHRHAAEVRMAESIREFYGDEAPPLPTGVVPFDPSEIEDDHE